MIVLFCFVLFQTQVNYCTSNPCANDGECISVVSSYQCRCANGYQGTNCQQDVTQPCASSPCL